MEPLLNLLCLKSNSPTDQLQPHISWYGTKQDIDIYFSKSEKLVKNLIFFPQFVFTQVIYYRLSQLAVLMEFSGVLSNGFTIQQLMP